MNKNSYCIYYTNNIVAMKLQYLNKETSLNPHIVESGSIQI